MLLPLQGCVSNVDQVCCILVEDLFVLACQTKTLERKRVLAVGKTSSRKYPSGSCLIMGGNDICIYIYTYIHIYIYMCIYVYVNEYVLVHICMYRFTKHGPYYTRPRGHGCPPQKLR